MKSFTQKAIVAVLMAAMLAPVAPFTPPKEAHAAWPTFTVGDAPRIIDRVLRAAAMAAAQAAIQSMTRSIVNWINSGFEGSPAFATDLQRNLLRVADAAAYDLLSGLVSEVSVEINSPFIDQAVGVVARGYLLYTSRDAITERLRYTLGQYSSNEAAFRSGRFNEGGFQAWMAMTFECGNDPYCAQFSIQEELARRIDADTRQRLSELDWGRGFMSWRCSCEEGQEAAPARTDGSVALSDEDRTNSCRICTPGSVLMEQTGFMANQPMLQLTVADSIDQIMGALASQLISQVIGATGLLGSAGGSEPGRNLTGLAQFGGATSTAAVLSASFLQTVQGRREDVADYQAAWQKIMDAARAARAMCESVIGGLGRDEENLLVIQEAESQARTAAARAERALGALDDIIERTQEIQRGGEGSGRNNSAVTRDYECLVSRGDPTTGTCVYVEPPVLPDPVELVFALEQSQDTFETTPESLYTKLKRIADNRCR